MRTGKTLSWLVALVGLWQLISPFMLGYSTIGSASSDAVIFGIVLIILGLWAALSNNAYRDQTLDWINAIVGLWLIISPFALGFSGLSPIAMGDFIIVGIIVVILGVWAGVEFRSPTMHHM